MKSVILLWSVEDSIRIKKVSLKKLKEIHSNSKTLLPVVDQVTATKPLLLARDGFGFVELSGVTPDRKVVMEFFFPDWVWEHYFDYKRSIESQGQLFLLESLGGGRVCPVPLTERDAIEATRFEAVCLVPADSLETSLLRTAESHKKFVEIQQELALEAESLKY